jgi:DNA-directed RNA polymerase alpha subunit
MEQVSEQTKVTITPQTLIADIEWPGPTVRIRNWLDHHGLKTVGDLMRYSEQELRRIPQIGKGSAKSIKEVLQSAGLSLVDHCPRCGAPTDSYGRYRGNNIDKDIG